MDDHSYILFNQTPHDLRRIGARGGRASGRARRARRNASLTGMQAVSEIAWPEETAAEAIAALDAQFPWLIGAEKRHSKRGHWLVPSAAEAPLFLPSLL